MTTAALSIIARLRETGATLTRSDDGRIHFLSPTSIPADLLAEARQHREAIAEALAAAALLPKPDWSEAESERLESLNRKMADGYLRAALRRPPSWWRAEAHRPTPGATCACCGGARWWSRDECSWCCATCHPPDGLTDAEFVKVGT